MFTASVAVDNYDETCCFRCRVAGGGGCAAWARFFGARFSFPRQRSITLYYLSCIVLCLRFRGCPVAVDIELSASARHQQTRVLLCARRLVLLLVAAAVTGGVRHNFQNCMQQE